MKKNLTLIALFIFSFNYATDRFVDPNLSSGNGITLFTNITSAVAAAVNGDRIIVASNTYNEATLTIDKSLKILPQTSGATINFNANIVIAGFPGMKLEILGFNLGIYSISTNSIPSGSYNNRAKVCIIDSLSSNIGFDNDYYELNLIKSFTANDVNFRYGNLISNVMNNCYLFDEVNSNINSMDKIFIVGNTISSSTFIFNDNYKFIISNNVLKDFFVSKWILDSSQTNYITNNDFSSNCKIYFACLNGNAPYNGNVNDYIAWNSSLLYNFKFLNNKFLGSVLFARRNTSTVYPNAFGCLFYGSDLNAVINVASYSSTLSDWPNVNANGFFDWSYNGLPIQMNGSGSLIFTNSTGPVNEIDGGNPNHQFYDIDLTINDRGINGGPYSQLNYTPSNPTNSKAFIFDLDMPTDLFPGQNVNITAKGYHKN